MRLHRHVTTAVLVAGVLSFGTGVHGADYSIDPMHSNVGFRIRHMVSQVKGQFTDFTGTFSYDPAAPDKSSVEAVIQARSVNTNVEKRDEHLRSADFFDVAKFPTLTFKSSSVKSAGPGMLMATGTLTLHGVSKPAVLSIQGGDTVKDPWGGTRTGFTASTTINRKDFGMVWNKTLDNGGLLIGEDVKIEIEVEGVQKK